jgi:hypothetical protein
MSQIAINLLSIRRHLDKNRCWMTRDEVEVTVETLQRLAAVLIGGGR